MIHISNLNKSYEKNITVLNDLNLNFKKVGFYFIVGKSGSGKSTLLNILALNDLNFDGCYYYNGMNVKDMSASQVGILKNFQISIVQQDFNLAEDLTVYDNLNLMLEITNQKDDKKISSILTKLQLKNYEKRYISELSKGEKQRVLIARALLKNPSILILDEPTSSLDVKTTKTLFDILKPLSKSILIIISTHNKTLVDDYADEIYSVESSNILKEKKNDVIEKNFKLKKIKKPFTFYLKNLFSKNYLMYFNILFYFIILCFVIISFSIDRFKINYPVYQKEISGMKLANDVIIKLEGIDETKYSSYQNAYFVKKNVLTGIRQIAEIDEKFFKMTNLNIIGKIPQDYSEILLSERFINDLIETYSYIIKLTKEELLNHQIRIDRFIFTISGIIEFPSNHPLEERLSTNVYVKKNFLKEYYKDKNYFYNGLITEINFKASLYENNTKQDFLLSSNQFTTKIPDNVVFFDPNKQKLSYNEIIIDINVLFSFDIISLNRREELMSDFVKNNFNDKTKLFLKKIMNKENLVEQDYVDYIMGRFITIHPTNFIQPGYDLRYFESLVKLEYLNNEIINSIEILKSVIKNAAGGVLFEKDFNIVGVYAPLSCHYYKDTAIISQDLMNELKEIFKINENNESTLLYVIQDNKESEDFLKKNSAFLFENSVFRKIESNINDIRGNTLSMFIYILLSIFFIIANLLYCIFNYKIKEKKNHILKENGLLKNHFMMIYFLEQCILSFFILLFSISYYKIYLNRIYSNEIAKKYLLFYDCKEPYIVIIVLVILGTLFSLGFYFLIIRYKLFNKKIIKLQ